MANCILIGGGDGEAFNIKSLTYTGSNTTPNTIIFPETPKMIFGIVNTPGTDSRGYVSESSPFIWGACSILCHWYYDNGSYKSVSDPETICVTYSGNSITIYGEDAGASLNYDDAEYTVYYI